MAGLPILTPTMRLVFRELVVLPAPVTYAALTQKVDRSHKAVESVIHDLRAALRPAGVEIVLQRRSRNEVGHFVVLGPPQTIAALAEGSSVVAPEEVRRVEGVSLPSVRGVSYRFAPEGRLVVGGVVQPARVA